MSDPVQRSKRRRAILAGAALLVALLLFFSQADENSWLGRTLGGKPRDPFAGLAVLPTPSSAGMVTCLPPAAGTAGAVLPPLFRFELAPGVRVEECTVLVYRDRDGDRAAGEGESLFDAAVGLLPRDDGTFGPDGWALRVPLEQDAGPLLFRVSLRVRGEVLGWQGEVLPAAPHDPRS
ncbi:MAG: hypothetical protein H6831_10130 [Planctomycetes bacterium]|nr:hypothetical protein [Planctomycetota bacterium]MCB9904752.1 hypothetical protein [Planctomycetota bacterium]